ncbi:TetR/AcrR family transcriptional regulator [Cryobacterium arcticum]|uniref:TetR family transcriptional regulator n=1 Tax=Cryobacterium arcticum TaxID=670052 RepID=A0A317ZRM7_9MICO|nr:TetR/AcrR family transcriptional regulator [Cryobacterium arcticum]PXA69819.1 TetR family transcriptional regulator [Cryobacterium arcticum]
MTGSAPTLAPSTIPPALRADAARNRESIVCAAAKAYASRGTDVSLEDVAHLAGVGVGTVYRRFPTKQALLDTLFEGKMSEFAEHAEQMAALACSDPWRAFSEHVLFLVGEQAKDLAFSDLLRDPEATSPAFQEHHRRSIAASQALVRAAQQAGLLRDGFSHSDLLLITDANHGVVQHAGQDAAAASERFGRYMLQAFSSR